MALDDWEKQNLERLKAQLQAYEDHRTTLDRIEEGMKSILAVTFMSLLIVGMFGIAVSSLALVGKLLTYLYLGHQ